MIGLGIETSGTYEQVRADRDAAKANRRLLELNAELAELQAEDALARGAEAAGQVRSETRQLVGLQRARLAAQGVDVNSGSAADIQADTALLGELDALAVANNASREAWGHRVHAADYRLRGVLEDNASRNRARGTVLTLGAQALPYVYDFLRDR